MSSLDDHFAHRWMEDRAKKSNPVGNLHIAHTIFFCQSIYPPFRSPAIKQYLPAVS
jgi:hypothetical protein